MKIQLGKEVPMHCVKEVVNDKFTSYEVSTGIPSFTKVLGRCSYDQLNNISYIIHQTHNTYSGAFWKRVGTLKTVIYFVDRNYIFDLLP